MEQDAWEFKWTACLDSGEEELEPREVDLAEVLDGMGDER